ncbi:MAG: hypothetical protein FWE45_00025 [Firmicutes bacterium]|nr:hypothetical protein [Bacillota bacterium]
MLILEPVMGILRFSKMRAYSIVLIGMVALGVIFLILGTVFSITGTNIPAQSMSISAPGAYRGAGGIYRLNVYSRTTPIVVSALPWSTTEHVRMSLDGAGAGFVSLSSRANTVGSSTLTMTNGSAAFIVLNNNAQGVPHFHNDLGDPPNRIILNITVGIFTETVYIFIRLSRENVQIANHLQWRQGVGFPWANIDEVSLNDDPEAIRRYRANPNNFRILSTFHVIGFSPQPTLVASSEFNPAQFTARDLGTQEVQLFPFIIPEWVTSAGEFSFEVAVNFNGQRFVDFFDLTIVQ